MDWCLFLIILIASLLTAVLLLISHKIIVDSKALYRKLDSKEEWEGYEGSFSNASTKPSEKYSKAYYSDSKE